LASRAGKKAGERAVLDHLLRFTGMAAAVLEEGEAPDFILDVEGQRVGLEVTEYIRGRSSTGSALRQQHRFIQMVLRDAKLAFEAHSDMPLWVTVDAEPGRAAASLDALAKVLADRVADCLGGNEIPPRLGPFGMTMPASPLFHECEVPSDLEPIIGRLTVVELPNRSVARWKIRQSGDTRAYVDEIAALIASKDERYPAYLLHCSEAWLAIDAFGGDILQAITPSAEMVQHRYRTAFRRVYVVDRAEPRVLRLDTEPPR
jgi:hypothetical protein